MGGGYNKLGIKRTIWLGISWIIITAKIISWPSKNGENDQPIAKFFAETLGCVSNDCDGDVEVPYTSLVGGLERELYVSIYWECHPNWRAFFFRGVGIPPTSIKFRTGATIRLTTDFDQRSMDMLGIMLWFDWGQSVFFWGAPKNKSKDEDVYPLVN